MTNNKPYIKINGNKVQIIKYKISDWTGKKVLAMYKKMDPEQKESRKLKVK